jgi:Reductase C-terminal
MPLRNVPFFWTYHFDKTIKYLGRVEEWDDVSIIGDVRRLNFIALLSNRDKVIALVSCGRDEETALLAELMRKPISLRQARGLSIASGRGARTDHLARRELHNCRTASCPSSDQRRGCRKKAAPWGRLTVHLCTIKEASKLRFIPL